MFRLYLKYSIYVILISISIVLYSCKTDKSDKASQLNVQSDFQITEDMSSDSSDIAQDDYKLTAYDTPPVPVQNPMPAYPSKYRNSGIQGVVVLEVQVLNDGTVGDIKVMKSLLSKEGGLDEVAVNAVKTWIFKPALKNNQPVESKVTIPIPFSLRASE